LLSLRTAMAILRSNPPSKHLILGDTPDELPS
jgi:hypothetical protein